MDDTVKEEGIEDILSLALQQSEVELSLPLGLNDMADFTDTFMTDLTTSSTTLTGDISGNKNTTNISDKLSSLLEQSTKPTTDTDKLIPSLFIPPTTTTTTSTSLTSMSVDDVLLQLFDPPPPPPSHGRLPIAGMIGAVSVSSLSSPSPATTIIKLSSQVKTAQTSANPSIPPSSSSQVDEEIEEEEDQYISADTYSNYKPAKLKLGYLHPDPIVESSSLSSVEPPQVFYDLKYPENVIEEVKLSSLQLEAVVYACQQHMNTLADGSRAGFLIGDGAGVGKGRTVAGIIYQNYLEGRKKALWLSVSNDLKYDAIRDLHDVGAKKISVYALNKFCYGKISGKRNGRVKKGVIFSTYSSLIGESNSGGKYRTRFSQLLHWLGPHFDGVIIFDECHKAKNLVPSGAGKPSKTGITVLQLQKKLPKARIVYCSATGATEPKNMAYMSRLGIWGSGTQFPTFHDFIKSVERRGVGAMEIVAMDMKLRGLYIARQLSFSGVNFTIEEIPLSPKFVEIYDKSVAFWVEARKKFREAAYLLDYDRKSLKTIWGQFWAAHQRFFKYLCIAAKVPSTIKLALQCLKEGKCVVIGLQSTGEAQTLEQLGHSHGSVDGFVSTAKGVLHTLIKRHFPVPSGNINWKIFEKDPTLPENNRTNRKRGAAQMDSSDEDSSSSGCSDVESSDDEEDEDMMEESIPNDKPVDDDSDSDSDSMDDKDFLSMFGPDEPNWSHLGIPKSKKPKLSAKSKKRSDNYSIKAPSSGEFEEVSSSSTVNDKKTKSSLSAQQETSHTGGFGTCDISTRVRKMKEDLMRGIEELAPLLPSNSLDQLIDGLGGPEYVSEMTGRRGRIVTTIDGSVQYQLRTEPDVSIELLNITEKQRFMDGEKDIAIISEAASSGISLQADKRAKNQKRRVHITLELPWSADKAIQQFGRTHRSNQVTAPEYVFLISNLSGEHRFASIVAKRLESLGALTHGDRRATESRDFSRYNIDTKYGRQCLEVCLKSLVGQDKPLISSPQYNQEFIENAKVAMADVELLSPDQKTVDKESLNMTRFLNRLLGLPVDLQNLVFRYFTDTLAEIIKRVKRAGRWDGGILDYGATGEQVVLLESKEYVGDAVFGTATTELHKIHVERGMSFDEALLKLNTDHCPKEGFYLSNKMRNDKNVAVMLKVSKEGSSMFLVHRPNTGIQSRPEHINSLLKKYKLCSPEEAEKWWKLQYDSTLTSCSHSFWQGKCRSSSLSHPCEIGMRRRTSYVLTGSLLGVWTHLETVFMRHPTHAHKMQMVRVHTPKRKLIGILIPTPCVTDLNSTLEKIASQAAGSADNTVV